ncbi:MAG: M67 family metallopeptidase [Planctomycetota bacterium]|jgi:proteasome lid subunit RPN8/RPN11
MTELVIPPDILEHMLAWSRAHAPVEACGILAGRNNKVERLYEMTNIDNSSHHFMMEPREQFAVVKDIRALGLEMLAIYHSHPAAPAKPSQEDIRLALTPDVAYVIVSLQKRGKPVIKGFAFKNNTLEEVPVNIKKVRMEEIL